MKEFQGVKFAYGRYGQFTFEHPDRRVQSPTGRLVWACRSCEQPVTAPRRRFYCGKACEKAFGHRIWLTRWDHYRTQAVARDGHRCVLCGHGPMDEDDMEDAECRNFLSEWLRRPENWQDPDREFLLVFLNYGSTDQHTLEVDHILPVATHPELEFTLSNLRTLCRSCHKTHGAKPRKPRP